MRITGVYAALLGAALLFTACSTDLVNETGVRLPASTTQVPVGLADACPPRDTPARFPAGGNYPDGAIAVRLCNPKPLDPGHDGRADVPEDLLEEGVDEFVEALDAAPLPTTFDPPPVTGELKHFCPANGGPQLVWWVMYPDGTAWSAAYYAAGCEEVVVDTGLGRPGGSEVMRNFSDLLVAQRTARTPPVVTRRPTCASDLPQTPLVDPERTGLASAVRCNYSGAMTVSFDLGPAALDRLAARVRDGGTAPDNRCEERGRTYVGVTTWGDAVTFNSGCFPAS